MVSDAEHSVVDRSNGWIAEMLRVSVFSADTTLQHILGTILSVETPTKHVQRMIPMKQYLKVSMKAET